ncbi:alginate O-acetyltransferase AlgX-related protein [Desulfovibrio aminophilus]|uniref:alginate O-acetyltransferase AlgX-related protein n=1 Tax=Desulfovibrio aminophilus TaxID=81425 RepID=UPI00041D82FE|nr:GDSL-type esterase/lipase family protein [Desulfovibrio aminophilus]
MRRALQHLGLAVAAVLLTLLGLEGLCRTTGMAPDLPKPIFRDGVMAYAPNQTGTYMVRDEIRASYRINAQGWNSGRADSLAPKTGTRVVVIGDSYVEALQVDADQSLAEDLERLSPGTEVLRCGLSGIPLSQYVHLARRETPAWSPDVLVILLVHNDFLESFIPPPGVHQQALLRLDVEDGRVLGERPIRPYVRPWYGLARESALWRYLRHRRQLGFQTLRDLILGKEPEIFQANMAPRAVAERLADVRAATDYLFGELDRASQAQGARLVLLMDGDRGAIEAGHPGTSDALILNRLSAELAARRGIPFLDLHPAFAADFADEHQPFAFPHDGHWNARGHAVAARALAAFLRDRGLIP